MKRLSKIKWFTLGVAVCLILVTLIVPAFAASITKTAQLVYNDIKITLNGGAITPKDANGNVVEPFIIDGTTYLPVRAVGNALGLGVGWDGLTNTVQLAGSASGASSSEALPFLQLHDIADEFYEDYALISDYRNLIYIIYGRIGEGRLNAAGYADFVNTVNDSLDFIYSDLVRLLESLATLEGAHNSIEFRQYYTKAQTAQDNLFYAYFALEEMAQAADDLWNGRPGSDALIDSRDSYVGEYLGISRENLVDAQSGSLEKAIDFIPVG